MRPAAQLQATIDLLDEIAVKCRPADRCMADYFRARRYIGAKDKRAISESLYNILRNKLSYSYLLEQHGLTVNPRMLCAALIVLEEKELGDYFNNQPHAPKPLFVGDKESLEKITIDALSSAPMHVQLNIPKWLFPELESVFGERLAPEMRAMNARATTDIRVNTLKTNNDEVQSLLQSHGFDMTPTPISPWGIRFNQRVALFGLDAFKKGWFEVQDEGSQLLALVSGVKAGDKVVDFCAGAGGKTLALAAMMQNKGVIYASDVHSKRLSELTKRCKRAGVNNVRVHTLSSEHDKWVKQHKQIADVVLIDAPCTGTGTWRRSPDSRWNLTAESLENLLKTQQSILQSASRLVKPGGKILYATCSLLQRENEDQVSSFLESNSEFEYAQLEARELLLAQKDKLQLTESQLRTYPQLSSMDGFYVCVMRRKETHKEAT